VRGGVGIGDVAVPAAAHDASVADDDGAYRDLAGFEGALGRAQGFFHPQFVGGGGRGAVLFRLGFQGCAHHRQNLKSVFTTEAPFGFGQAQASHGEAKGEFRVKIKNYPGFFSVSWTTF